jgi:deoxyribose-phosphate aldolase
MKLDIEGYIDFTLLKPEAPISKYDDLCKTAIENGFYSVCIPPYMISHCKQYLKNTQVRITTVIGFPLGYNTIETKKSETIEAIKDGADEIDAVINVSAFKSGQFSYTQEELKELRKVSKNKILKIIIENCYLTPEEIAKLSKMVSESGADFVKTSTGFGTYGARLEDVAIMKSSISPNTKIKAAGGIKTYEQAISFISAGANRIGASSILKP